MPAKRSLGNDCLILKSCCNDDAVLKPFPRYFSFSLSYLLSLQAPWGFVVPGKEMDTTWNNRVGKKENWAERQSLKQKEEVQTLWYLEREREGLGGRRSPTTPHLSGAV